MSVANFVHLKVHSEFSLVDGMMSIGDFIEKSKQHQFNAVALTDHVNLFGLVKFFKKAVASGIKPIIGSDLLLKGEEEVSQCTALCMNDQGYHNLLELLSGAYLGRKVETEPVVSWAQLAEKSEGLIILSGGVAGDVGQALLAHQPGKAKELIGKWVSAFPDRFYLEINRTLRAHEEDYIHQIVPLAGELNIPVVATNDVRFAQASDFQAHEARVCIHQGFVLEDSRRPKTYSKEQYLKSTEEMEALFQDIPEALENTLAIAQRCNVKLTLGEVFLPNYPIPNGYTIESYFAEKAQKGLEDILVKHPPDRATMDEYQSRLKRELDVIMQMGFPGYFLIVADFIQWAKKNGIPVGPGRGSGAGSLVAYSLQITTLDPLEHELLFERFLNPERVSMPDFDIDFCMERRDEVIQYVADKYGRDAVSQIITFGTMAAKAVVRDVGRVLGLPYGFVDKIAKLIPFELGMTLEKAMAQEELLRQRYNQEDEVRTLIDLARKLEGVSRNAGKHAGGVLIAPRELSYFAPIYCEPGGESLVSQFDKDDVEEIGLVKFDFLGLRTLTIIDWTVQAINQRANHQATPLDIEAIPLADEKTFSLLKSCATSAVFQLESRGMKDLIRRLQPDSFEDITALVALFRPGPLQSGMVDDFIARKHGQAKVEYPHPEIEPILKPTYGVILYQEQVMQIAQVLANYTLGGADILRRAMGKKKPEEMAKQRAIFLAGAAERNIDKHVANHIFDLMEKFAGYGFNKSHSAAYALIAYQTAYLKAHFPSEFMAAVLSSDMDNTDKVVGFLQETKRMKVKVNPPHINVSNYKFTANAQGEIEYGLGAIKGAGEAALLQLVAEREQAGPYEDLFDLCSRLDTRKLNRKGLEALIKAGALDGLAPNRATLLASIDKALKYADQQHKSAELGQDDLFGGGDGDNVNIKVEYNVTKPWLVTEKLQHEKESLGYYLSGHPLSFLGAELKHFTTTNLAQVAQYLGQTITVAGVIQNFRSIMTKSGRRMAVFTLEDCGATVEATAFSEVFEKAREWLVKDNIVVLKGELQHDEFTGGYKVNVEAVTSLDKMREKLARQLVLSLDQGLDVSKLVLKLADILKEHSGEGVLVVVRYQQDDAQVELQFGEDWRVALKPELILQLQQLLGENSVQIQY